MLTHADPDHVGGFDAALVYHGSSVTEGAREVLDRYVNFPGRPEEPLK